MQVQHCFCLLDRIDQWLNLFLAHLLNPYCRAHKVCLVASKPEREKADNVCKQCMVGHLSQLHFPFFPPASLLSLFSY